MCKWNTILPGFYDVRFAQKLSTRFNGWSPPFLVLSCTRFHFQVPVSGFEHPFPVLNTRSRFWAPVPVFVSLHLKLFLDLYMTFEVISDSVEILEHVVADDKEQSAFAEVGISFLGLPCWSDTESGGGVIEIKALQYTTSVHCLDCLHLIHQLFLLGSVIVLAVDWPSGEEAKG
jgi:hypothetical protein